MWRRSPKSGASVVEVNGDPEPWCQGLAGSGLAKDWKGEWCKLVSAEELETAYQEGFEDGYHNEDVRAAWLLSQTKRIIEGIE